MKTKKQKSLVTIFVFLSFCLACEFENDMKPEAKMETFKVDVINDTVPSEVHVITKFKLSGANKLEYIHEGAYSSLEGIKQSNQHLVIRNSKKTIVLNDTLILFYKVAGVYKILLKVNNDQQYEETFELFE
jgi:hypothetical protein